MFMELRLVKNEPKYYEFIRLMRTHPENQKGFLEQVDITINQQKQYMEKYCNCYFLCLSNENPVGYIGVIDNEIRICTNPNFKKKGVGTFMLNEISKIFPNPTAKILKNNIASLNLFKKCKFSIVRMDEKLYYLNKTL